MDYGSNSVGYLIAEQTPDGLQYLERSSRYVRLSEHVASRGRLDPAAVQRTLEWTRFMSARLTEFGVTRVRAVGTEALRRAGDAASFTRRAGALLRCELEIIAGEEEGRLTFQGVRHAYPAGPLLVLDIGGGSSEIIAGAAGAAAPIVPISLPVGVVNLTEAHGEDLEALENAVTGQLGRVSFAFPLAAQITVLGGTGLSLARMDLERASGDDHEVEGHLLDYPRLLELRDQARALGVEQRGTRWGVPPRRADVMVAGCVILQKLMERLELDRLRVSRFNLRHGLLLSLLARIIHEHRD